MSQDKKEFRIKALKIRSELSFRAEKDCKIRQKVIKLLSGIKSDSLFFYLSMGSEVDTKDIISELFGKKEIFVPYTFKENMTPVKLPNLDMIYKTDKLGNAEGIENFLSEATRFDAEALRKNIDVTVVPMLAFNKDKFRLGYGGGYYDRYLFCRHTVKIGLAYDEQQNDEIEFEKHDVPLDVIVTPTRVIGRI